MIHGLRSSYYRGCRCNPCSEANRDYKRSRRARFGKPEVARPKETLHPSQCAVCFFPISEHRPYFAHVRTT